MWRCRHIFLRNASIGLTCLALIHLTHALSLMSVSCRWMHSGSRVYLPLSMKPNLFSCRTSPAGAEQSRQSLPLCGKFMRSLLYFSLVRSPVSLKMCKEYFGDPGVQRESRELKNRSAQKKKMVLMQKINRDSDQGLPAWLNSPRKNQAGKQAS